MHVGDKMNFLKVSFEQRVEQSCKFYSSKLTFSACVVDKSRMVMKLDSFFVFRVKFNVDFTSQAMDFP